MHGFALALVVIAAACGRVNFESVTGDSASDTTVDAYAFTGTRQHYIKASNTETNDTFGHRVHVSGDGNTISITAPRERSSATGIDGNQTSNAAANAGAVYVFGRAGATWAMEAYVKASNTDAGDTFGQCLTLSHDGTTLAVGAVGEDSSAVGIDGNEGDNSTSDSGAVYVYTRSGATWTQQAYIKASNPGALDGFGVRCRLSADGNTLAVSARNEDSSSTGINGVQNNEASMDSGAVYVFTRSGTTWSQQAYVKPSTIDPGDQFGAGLALSGDGDTLVVGAPDEDSAAKGVDGDQSDNTSTSAGASFVFTRTGTVWTQVAYLKASNSEADDRFGEISTISHDGSTIAIGAYLEDSAAAGVNGNQASNAAASSGAVYVYVRTGATWSQQAYVKASNLDSGDLFGGSVWLSGSGDVLAVGAQFEAAAPNGASSNPADNSVAGAGAVYVLLRTGTTWMQHAYVKATHPSAMDDLLGGAISMSASGAVIVAGANLEDGSSRGVGGAVDENATDSGAAFVFE